MILSDEIHLKFSDFKNLITSDFPEPMFPVIAMLIKYIARFFYISPDQ